MIRVLDTPDDVARFNIAAGWHWFARKYPNGKWSQTWRTTLAAARKGMKNTRGVELWGYDASEGRWVKDKPFQPGRYV